MALTLDDTIAAIGTASGGAARGMIRISGPATMEIVARLAPQTAHSRSVDIKSGVTSAKLKLDGLTSVLPVDIYLWPNARSYTRQPTAELHTLGSSPLLRSLLEAVCQHGARLAEPGEFTLRAFLAGRLDLTQAEAVLAVIDSKDQGQLSVALGQLAGGLAQPLQRLRDELLDVLAELEAGLDFVEEDIEFIEAEVLSCRLHDAGQQIEQILKQMISRTSEDDRATIVLVGEPNVGKSSLLNALADDDAAIVSDQAGTTRDYVTREVNLGGWSCSLVDTAGVAADTSCDPDEDAQIATAAQIQQADLQMLCLDSTRPISSWEQLQLRALDRRRSVVVLTKCDLLRRLEPDLEPDAVLTSSKTGQGMTALVDALSAVLSNDVARSKDVVPVTATRCRESLRGASESLQRASKLAANSAGEELVASEIRGALSELGKVVGAVYTEDVLDRIFGKFCIGK